MAHDCADIRQKVVDHFHIAREAEFSMFVPAELAHGDKGVDVSLLPVKQASVTPQLRWPPVVQYATQALATGTQLAAVPPQYVGGADQPVFMCHVEFQGIATGHQARAANQ